MSDPSPALTRWLLGSGSTAVHQDLATPSPRPFGSGSGLATSASMSSCLVPPYIS